MKKLTQKDVLKMNKQERKEYLEYYENLCSNTDYIKNNIEYSFYAENVDILISKIEYNEY